MDEILLSAYLENWNSNNWYLENWNSSNWYLENWISSNCWWVSFYGSSTKVREFNDRSFGSSLVMVISVHPQMWISLEIFF